MNDAEAPIFKAHNARDIHRFFRAVTRSVTNRTASQNPDISTAFVVPPDDDALDLDFQMRLGCLRRERHRPPTPRSGEPNQDAMVLVGCRGGWITAVADGLGSRARRDLGARSACQVTRQILRAKSSSFDLPATLPLIHKQWLEAIDPTTSRRRHHAAVRPSDRSRRGSCSPTG